MKNNRKNVDESTHKQLWQKIIAIISRRNHCKFWWVGLCERNIIVYASFPLVSRDSDVCACHCYSQYVSCRDQKLRARMCMGRVLLRFSLTDFVFIVYYIRPSLSKLNIYTFRWRRSIFVFNLQAVQRWVILLEAVIHICGCACWILFAKRRRPDFNVFDLYEFVLRRIFHSNQRTILYSPNK